jgi:hypothetical protein
MAPKATAQRSSIIRTSLLKFEILKYALILNRAAVQENGQKSDVVAGRTDSRPSRPFCVRLGLSLARRAASISPLLTEHTELGSSKFITSPRFIRFSPDHGPGCKTLWSFAPIAIE